MGFGLRLFFFKKENFFLIVTGYNIVTLYNSDFNSDLGVNKLFLRGLMCTGALIFLPVQYSGNALIIHCNLS